MITDLIKAVQSANHLGIGEYIEIAKGKNEYTLKWKDVKRKITRLWHLKRK